MFKKKKPKEKEEPYWVQHFGECFVLDEDGNITNRKFNLDNLTCGNIDASCISICPYKREK